MGSSTRLADHHPQQRPDRPALQAQPENPVEKPDRPAVSSRPHGEHRIRIAATHGRILRRWIEAQPGRAKTPIRRTPSPRSEPHSGWRLIEAVVRATGYTERRLPALPPWSRSWDKCATVPATSDRASAARSDASSACGASTMAGPYQVRNRPLTSAQGGLGSSTSPRQLR